MEATKAKGSAGTGPSKSNHTRNGTDKPDFTASGAAHEAADGSEYIPEPDRSTGVRSEPVPDDPPVPGTAVELENLRRCIPERIRNARCWLNWRYKTDGGKLPHYSGGGVRSGQENSPADLNRMVTFEEAAAKCSDGWGLGLAPRAELGLRILDLDKGAARARRELVNRASAHTYAEQSPSGKGVRVVACATGPVYPHVNSGDGLEVFGLRDFVTLTGATSNATPVAPLPGDIEAEIADLVSTRRKQRAADISDRVGKGGRWTALVALASHLRKANASQVVVESALLSYGREHFDDLDDVKQPLEASCAQIAADAMGWQNAALDFMGNDPGDDICEHKPPRIVGVAFDPSRDRCLPATKFLFEGDLFPLGKAGVFAGPGGGGKTTLALLAALCSATGRAFIGHAADIPGRVAIVTKEDTDEIVRWRLSRLADAILLDEEEHDLARSIVVYPLIGVVGSRLTDRNGPNTTFTDELRGAIAGQGPGLVVLDPFAYLSGGEENSNENGAAFMAEAGRLAADLDAHVLIIAHTGKAVGRGTTEPDQYGPRGASAIADGARWVATLTEVPADVTRPPAVVDALTAAQLNNPGLDEVPLLAFAVYKNSYSAVFSKRWLVRDGWTFSVFDVPSKRQSVRARVLTKVDEVVRVVGELVSANSLPASKAAIERAVGGKAVEIREAIDEALRARHIKTAPGYKGAVGYVAGDGS